MKNHRMVIEARNDSEVLYVCDKCDRRFVFNRKDERLTVIDKGDFFAHHSGGSLNISPSILQ